MTVKFTMLGVRFLDIGFMRINLACASPTVWLIGFFCTVVKGGAAAWSALRSQCRMEAPGRVRGMRRRHEPRASLILSCRRTSIMNPPVGGTFWFQIFIQAPSPEIWSETISGGEEVLAGKWGGLFWATSLEKIFDGVIAIISLRPGGWMQQSTVPRCAILSVGSTGGIGQ